MSLTEQNWKVIKKGALIFSQLFIIGTLIAYINDFSDPFGVGLSTSLVFLIVIYLFLQLREKISYLRWAFSYLGGYIGAVVVPITNLYLLEPNPWEFTTANEKNSILILILIIIGAFYGSICHVILKQTSLSMAVLGAVTFDIYLIFFKILPEINFNIFFFYQVVVGLLMGACIAGVIEFIFRVIKKIVH
jgi:hypothetical protein